MLREAACVEDELCSIIRSKDKQIDDYKASGATVSRRKNNLICHYRRAPNISLLLGHLETKEFNPETFVASRISRTIDESAREDITSLFCRVVVRLKRMYSVIVERIFFQRIAHRSVPLAPEESTELTKEISDRGRTQSPTKVTQMKLINPFK
jgi:hypothetical protein